MKTLSIVRSLLAAGLCLLPAFASAAVPSTLTHQGRLIDAENVPVDAALSLTFSLYDAASGGSSVYTGASGVVAIAKVSGQVAFSIDKVSSWTFAGPTAQMVVGSGEKVIASAQAPLATSGGSGSMLYDVCDQPQAGGTLTNFTGSGYSIGEVTAQRISWTASAIATPGAGTFKFGFCIMDNSIELVDNDDVNGWFMVTK